MKATIVNIGDEILIGQIVNTNSVYISKSLNKIGIEVIEIDGKKETLSQYIIRMGGVDND